MKIIVSPTLVDIIKLVENKSVIIFRRFPTANVDTRITSRQIADTYIAAIM